MKNVSRKRKKEADSFVDDICKVCEFLIALSAQSWFNGDVEQSKAS